MVCTVTALPTNGTLLLNGAALTINGTFTAAEIEAGQLTHTHNGSESSADSFSFTVTDGIGTTGSTDFAIAVNPVNDAPTVASPIPDQWATADTDMSLSLPAGPLTDVDSTDSLSYNFHLTSGDTLSAWLAFDATTLTLTGTPTSADTGTLSITVTATDSTGAFVSDTFELTVNPNGAETGEDTLTGDAGTTLPGDTVGDTLTGDAGATLPADTVGDTLTGDAGTSRLSGDTGSIPEGAGTTPLPSDTSSIPPNPNTSQNDESTGGNPLTGDAGGNTR